MEEDRPHHPQARRHGIAVVPLILQTDVMNVVEEDTMHTIVHGIEVEKIEKGRIVAQKDQGPDHIPDQEVGVVAMEKQGLTPDHAAGR